jgi:hypothetical protein
VITIPSARLSRPLSALTLGAVALLCAGLTGCSGGPSATPARNAGAAGPSSGAGAPAPDASAAAANGSACGLVTVAEVRTATGKHMTPGRGAGDICSFAAVGDPSLIVYIQVYRGAESLGVVRQEVSSGQHVSGLGDDAFWTVAGNLFVQKGSTGFTITLPSLALSSRTAPPKIVTLATAALTRL